MSSISKRKQMDDSTPTEKTKEKKCKHIPSLNGLGSMYCLTMLVVQKYEMTPSKDDSLGYRRYQMIPSVPVKVFHTYHSTEPTCEDIMHVNNLRKSEVKMLGPTCEVSDIFWIQHITFPDFATHILEGALNIKSPKVKKTFTFVRQGSIQAEKEKLATAPPTQA